MSKPRRIQLQTALRTAFACALIVLGVFLWRLAINSAQSLQSLSGLVCYGAGGRTAEDYESMLTAEQDALLPQDFALWSEQPSQYAKCPVTLANAPVSVLRVLGDVRLVLPAAGTLADGDAQGCLIDRQTARALFKTELAVGNQLQIGDEDYTVRGVFDGPGGTVILRAQTEDKLDLVSARSGGRDASFAQRHALGEPSPQPYAQLSGVLAALPRLAALWLLCALLLRAASRYRGYPLRAALLYAAAFAAATALVLSVFAALPSALIPSRWSDFAFYAEALRSLKTGAASLFTARKTRFDLYLASLCVPALWGVVSALLLCMANARLRLLAVREEGLRP